MSDVRLVGTTLELITGTGVALRGRTIDVTLSISLFQFGFLLIRKNICLSRRWKNTASLASAYIGSRLAEMTVVA